jgi:formyl-CoA transferase
MSATTTATTRPLLLQGIRVLDVSQVMVGPFACMMLTDMAPT